MVGILIPRTDEARSSPEENRVAPKTACAHSGERRSLKVPSGNWSRLTELTRGQHKTGAVMWWELLALVIATVLIPTIAIIGLFHVGALKRAKDLPPHVAEWAHHKIPETRKLILNPPLLGSNHG